MAEAQLLLIVDGVLVRDDSQMIMRLRAKIAAVQARAQSISTQSEALMSELSTALDSLQASLDTLVTEVEDLLTAPNPDIALALGRLGTMKTSIDAEVQRIRDAEQPPPTP